MLFNRYTRQQRLNPAEQQDPAMRSMMDAVNQVYTKEQPVVEDFDKEEDLLLTESICGAKMPNKTIKDRLKRAKEAVKPALNVTEDDIIALADKLEPFGILMVCRDAIRLAGPASSDDSYQGIANDSTRDQNLEKLTKKGEMLVNQCAKAVKGICGKDYKTFIEDPKMCEKIMVKICSEHLGREIKVGELIRLFGWDYSYMGGPFGTPSDARDRDLYWVALKKNKYLQ